jgi:hypothetical protein
MELAQDHVIWRSLVLELLHLLVQLPESVFRYQNGLFCFRDGKLNRRLVGMVVCSLSWWRGEWVGFTMGVALQPVVRRLLLPSAPVTRSPSLKPLDTPPDQLGTSSLHGRKTLPGT